MLYYFNYCFTFISWWKCKRTSWLIYCKEKKNNTENYHYLGTGKTETIKDLGKNFAIYVIVQNCSEALDYKSMGKMFSGFAQVILFFIFIY